MDTRKLKTLPSAQIVNIFAAIEVPRINITVFLGDINIMGLHSL